jgi:hypothetical protein
MFTQHERIRTMNGNRQQIEDRSVFRYYRRAMALIALAVLAYRADARGRALGLERAPLTPAAFSIAAVAFSTEALTGSWSRRA